MAKLLGAFLVVVSWVGAIHGEEAPKLVGEYADFKRFEFRGNDSFPDDVLCESLSDDLQLLPFRRADRRFQKLCKEIASELTTGYLHQGFPDIHVEAGWDSSTSRAVITIHEGRRYEKGDVIVGGANEEVSNSIQRWLTEPMPPLDAVADFSLDSKSDSDVIWRDQQGKVVKKEQPVWNRKKSCSFVPMMLQQLRPYVERAIKDHGYLEPKFTLTLVPDSTSGAAELQVNIETLGEVWKIEQIRIDGLTRHTREEVLKYLDVEIGEVITPQLLQRLKQKLTLSGAFRWSNVYAPPKLIPIAPTELRIELLESDLVPKLTEERDEVEKTIVRLSEWMNRFGEQDLDLAIETTDIPQPHFKGHQHLPKLGKVFFGHSPSGEKLFSVEFYDSLIEQMETVTVSWSQQSIRISLVNRNIAFEHQFDDEFLPTFTFNILGNPPSSDRDLGLGLGLGANNAPQASMIAVEPFATLAHLTKIEWDTELVDNELILKTEMTRWQIDAETGRHIDLITSDFIGEKKEKVTARIWTEKDGLKKYREQLKKGQSSSGSEAFKLCDQFDEFLIEAILRTPSVEPDRFPFISLFGKAGDKRSFGSLAAVQEAERDIKAVGCVATHKSPNRGLIIKQRCVQTHPTKLVTNSQLLFNRLTECFANEFDWNAVVDFSEEPFNNDVHRFVPGQATTHCVKHLFFVDLSGGCSVCAANVVGFDFESRNRIRAGIRTEHQRIVPLITVGFLGWLIDFDHSPPHAARFIATDLFVKKVRVGIGLMVGLLCVIGQQLLIGGECHSIDLGMSSTTIKVDVLVDMHHLAAEPADGPLHHSVSCNSSRLMGKVADFLVPVLKLNVS